MADNILTKDRDNTDIALAAKDIAGILTPRNILVNPDGEDITPLTDAQLRATAVPVSGTVTANTGLTQPITDAQLRASPVAVSQLTPPFVRIAFSEVGSGIVGKAAEAFELLQTGSGMAVNQSGGNLVITTGTTAHAETVIRSIGTFSGSLLARVKTILSQRIANNTFRYELADLVGDGLAFTINSATSITVTFPTTNPFTSANVGQSVRLSRIAGAAGIPGRYAIASVDGLNVNFTVASWPGSGSGTLSLYGWNYIMLEYSGTTATQASFDAQRRGWNSGNTTATISTTASPGHVAQLNFDVFTAGLSDALVASNVGYQWTGRASRIENIADPDVEMYLFIIAQNGSSNPASNTTWTIGFMQVEDQGRVKVRIASSDPSNSHAQPVYQVGGVATATQAISGTVTATNTTPTASNINSAATTNAAAVKTSAGTLFAVVASNSGAGAAYVKYYNKASAPTVGTDVPLITIHVPAGGTVTVPIGTLGHRFATGIALAITGAMADSDTTAVAANQVKVLTSYV